VSPDPRPQAAHLLDQPFAAHLLQIVIHGNLPTLDGPTGCADPSAAFRRMDTLLWHPFELTPRSIQVTHASPGQQRFRAVFSDVEGVHEG
jgi:hypothetical protein